MQVLKLLQVIHKSNLNAIMLNIKLSKIKELERKGLGSNNQGRHTVPL